MAVRGGNAGVVGERANMTGFSRQLTLFTAMLVTWAHGAAAIAASADVHALLDARLELMDEVAAYKYRAGLAVEDLPRESLVLERAVADAARLGFEPLSSRAFFTAQIEAAKEIQRYWIERWRSGSATPPAAVPDLDRTVRPELLRLGSGILGAAASTNGVSREDFDRAVAVEGLGEVMRTRVFESLRDLKRFESRLDRILATGVVRIGTTGDYAPFSHREEGSAHAGIDVDLGRHLAGALGVAVELVETSWPALLDDLADDRYDIAMSGVSRTLERQKQGYLSSPYYAGGKTAITRCRDADAFPSLAAIDRPGVRVVVNPGGTNERFVDRLEHARKVLHVDNRTIFQELLAGRADVMITDRIEVELQTARHQELCAPLPGNLTYQEKAYLLPRDGVWKAFVDTWLSLALADGTVARTFRAHGMTLRLPGTAPPLEASPEGTGAP